MPDKSVILDSPFWISVIIILAMVQKLIVDPILFYVLLTSLSFLLNRYKENMLNAGLKIPSLFFKSRIYLAIVIIGHISITIIITFQRLYAIPILEEKKSAFVSAFLTLFNDVYFPISNSFKSFGALFLTVYLCEQQLRLTKRPSRQGVGVTS